MRGGIVIAGLILLLGTMVVFASFLLPGGLHAILQDGSAFFLMVALFLLGLMGSIEATRRAVGKLAETYIRIVSRLLSGGKST